MTIVIDVDGCLTDGKVHYTHTGERSKSFHSRDIRAIKELIANGYEVLILTQSSWPGIKEYAKRTGANYCVADFKNVACKQIGEFFFVCDDVNDIETMRMAKRCFVPVDADYQVKKEPNVNVLSCHGGEGLIAELCRILL